MKVSKLLFLFLGLFSLGSCSTTAEIKGKDSTSQNKEKNKDTNDNKDNKDKDEEKQPKEEYKYTYYDDSDPFTAGAVKLSFNSAGNLDYLKGIDGQKVALKGFMFSASPVDGSFIFLSNMPYQSCPFCALNTSELSNCYEIYPKKNGKFSFTEAAICVVGTLRVSSDKSNLFTDKYGYEFLSKIEDGEVKILENIDQEEDFALRNAFASTTLLTDIYDMLNYVYFTCKWPEFFVNTYEDKYGEVHTGYYLYAADALHFLAEEDAQYNYGYKDGYFDNFITRIKKISETGFEDLIEIINDCKATANYAVSELQAGHYSAKKQYVEKFDTEDYIFTLDDAEIKNKPDDLYNRFSYWLTSFEM